MMRFEIDPEAMLDYAFDWSAWIGASETITSYTISADTGITVGAEGLAGAVVTGWLSCTAAAGFYLVKCKITTNAGRTDVRRMQLQIIAR